MRSWAQSKAGIIYLSVLLTPSAAASAQEPTPQSAEQNLEALATESTPEPAKAVPTLGTTVRGKKSPTAGAAIERAKTAVTRDEVEERQSRSAPDALRYEPGVFVQKTAHAQGSAFVRGLTGQQTLLMFDGIRLNNSTYRQGPNQYFFTLDAQTIDSIVVRRGGASTRYGSDAIGGVIAAQPLRAPAVTAGQRRIAPSVTLSGATADESVGGRLQLAWSQGRQLRVLAGVGGRRVGELEGSGVLLSPETGEPAQVPMMRPDGRTQAGTGFDELTFDGRVDARGHPKDRLSVAVYGYRQFDAPRTDQCPAAYAPFDECLRYEEQFRTLAYAAFDTKRVGALKRLRLTASWQQQHERKRLDRPSSFVQHTGRDSVQTLGLSLVGSTKPIRLNSSLRLKGQFGADHYADSVASKAWTELTDLEVLVERSRGQYLDGSRYAQGGVFIDLELAWKRRLSFLAGGRAAWALAQADADLTSGSQAVDATWMPVTGHAGLRFTISRLDALNLSLDRSFRAPNLDDLTSRQFTGPGFQFENAALGPEVAHSVELGWTRRARDLEWDLWGFRTELDGAIVRHPRAPEDCPPETPGCQASWTRFQLINAPDPSFIYGLEGGLMVRIADHWRLRTTAAWARGDGPNPALLNQASAADTRQRVPLSRIPPLNGTLDLRWRPDARRGPYAGFALRGAALQDQLALSDVSDERIPTGGTPGFVVADLRLGYRVHRGLIAGIVVENLTDQIYRYHGSAVNGPARGLQLRIRYTPTPKDKE